MHCLVFGYVMTPDTFPVNALPTIKAFTADMRIFGGGLLLYIFCLLFFYSKIAESIDSIGGWPLDDFCRWHTSGSEALSQQRLNHHAKTH